VTRTEIQSVISYIHNLVSLQPRRCTRSSYVITLSRPPTILSLKITDRSFRYYASPRLWNQLSHSFRQPNKSCIDSPSRSFINPSLSSSPFSASSTPTLFHSRLVTYLFNKSFQPQLLFFTYWTAFMIMGLDGRIMLISLFL